MTHRSILIAGASIAGPALAYWLRRYGMDVAVVERAPELRMGGQAVDLRGLGREVARRMGIEEAVRARTTREDGIAFVDAAGRTRAAFGVADGEGFVADLEILRGDLAEILHDRTRDGVEYIFDDRITAIADDGDGVRVGFLRGGDRRFDLVVAADGIRSGTRGLVFGDDATIKPLGLYMAYFTIPRQPSDGTWSRWYNAPGSRTVFLRPDNVGTTRALLSFQSPPRGYEDLDQAGQKAVLRRIFADAGWEAPRALAALDATPDFYFESIGQVTMPSWSKGRVALVGDAGYCPSPISGMGTSLALVGAYILAGELARHDDHRQAFAAYENLLRPYVEKAQELPPGTPRLASPRSRIGIAIGLAVLRVASIPALRKVMGRLFASSGDVIALPDYRG